ncbi:MAG TPA: M50 family peptidase [Gemmatimonadetes bacterium]|nr:M50 family peptidase [Gemmatimonadota bacterium]
MTESSGGKLWFIVGFAAFFAALWFFWDTSLVYPLKIFVVLLHEISHAIASVATGGGIEKITLDPRQGGACHCFGGNAFITLSAGYLGSLLWGGAMFSAARSDKVKTSWVNGFIGAMVVALTVFFVRGGFGMIFGIAFGLTMIFVSKQMGSAVNRGLLLTLGLTSALYAILDIKSDVFDRPNIRSDAAMLSEITGVSTTIWGLIWISIAIAVSVWLMRRAYKDA